MAVWAHSGSLRGGGYWWAAWNTDPVLLLNLALLGWLYARGLGRLWERGRPGRVVSRGHAAAFAGALLTLVLALASPLDALAEELSWAHMVQHMLLITVAAPLFVLAAPGVVLVCGLPPPWRQRAARWGARLRGWPPVRELMRRPLALWLLNAGLLWAWHLPPLYQAALRSPVVHDLQHLSFFGGACLYWRVLLGPLVRPRLDPGVGVLYLFTTSLHATLLGALMALAPRAWYPIYAGRTEAWGLTALEDQQLAGAIMWMPACAAYAVAAAALLGRWLCQDHSPRAARA